MLKGYPTYLKEREAKNVQELKAKNTAIRYLRLVNENITNPNRRHFGALRKNNNMLIQGLAFTLFGSVVLYYCTTKLPYKK